MDPLFAWDGRVTAKSDVYSFGTVLVELITRKKVTALGGEVGSIHEFTNALTGGTRRTREMFDSEILSNNKMKTLEGVAKLAGECMQLERDKRPNMTHVVERLRMLRKVLHQDQRQQPVDLFSWLRRKKPASADVVTFPVKTLSSDLLSPHFTYAEMKAATNNFDQSLLVGEGSKFGRVYRGIVDGTTTKVVIRRCEDLSMRRRRDFHNQIEMLSKLRHDHLVPLMGYCHEKDEMILVYDYMPGGSLQEHLYRTQKPKLTWKQRIEICIGAARGLCYLHKLQIIHGAVKTTNILLDEEWVAKITDLDPAKASSEVETTMLGSCAGLAPEYILSGRFTKKSDVYSFGVVLLEVLCARPILDRRVPQEQANLVDWALRCKKKGNLEQIVDPYLKGRISRQCLNKYGEAAKKCLADRDINRPSMGDVISYLEDALELQSLSEAN
ncbi:hypothetical protein PR202_gn00058 [Eleusine coracana subsp. coracana]|uniref:Protein kinase domain-containing protein n=1 Tax=Eleusine coracana subsp. coracana TaxID=191504 RepID=A0AAV5G1K8_ELECO|nr:hypothetical protein PR202_gb20067 [Eleusine coracana subsp. coracana]GJN40760.1 hypothetical protein PR202_gn00058 [Eleusine coracana subsp. coracana]